MDFAWIKPLDAAIIDRDHPDFEYWEEVQATERIVFGGPAEAPPMPRPPRRPEGPPPIVLAVGREQAAALLSISVDTFERHVLPELRVVQVGRRQLVTIRALEAWLASNEARALHG
jgi:hypothetical protein